MKMVWTILIECGENLIDISHIEVLFFLHFVGSRFVGVSS